MTLTAPFPWYGGKRRVAPTIWERLGSPDVYVEPFAGSLACLLARPGGAGPREIVCDLDGGIANMWRALAADPEAVAYWADWPTIHQDLTARHLWLRRWVAEHRDRLSEDPEFFDAKAAGWWLWGISLWIGGGWCATHHERMPRVERNGGGVGCNAQHTGPPGQRPYVNQGGQGVSAQRAQMPHVKDTGGGSGVSAQRVVRPALLDWFAALQQRLAAVVVLNRDWTSALTPSCLQQTARSRDSTVGVLLDPPYVTADRSAGLYGSDLAGVSDDAAAASWAWAVEHGDRYRIAYCAHEGDIEPPDGWAVATSTLAGIRDPDRRHRRDLVTFSPACQPPAESTLFDATETP